MRSLRWAIYLWPGLADLWWHGAWSGLALASSYAVLTGLVLAATLVWDELLGPDLDRTIWGAYAVGWLALLFVSMRTSPRAKEAQLAGASDLFPEALAEYLRGNWLEAELLARKQVAGFPSDVESTVLLAATLRHTNRFNEARETLDAAALWERATLWKLEIDTQYQRLTEKENRLALLAHPARQPPPAPPAEEMEHKVLDSEDEGKTLPEWRQAA
ncbi:MAG TPA: hypothetical protein VGN12_26790 [Pirellulales bacterium]|jgi:hypothetical protein